MTLSQWEHPEAIAEFDAAVRWYEEQKQGIGLRFIEHAQQARLDIAEWPEAAPLFATGDDGTVIRSKRILGYPYHSVYSVEPNLILILAYSHDHREPGYWLDRLNS